MIVSAVFRNVLSFDNEVKIDFLASKSPVRPEQVSRGGRDSFPVLKTSLIFGSNGAGKSNICRCIHFMQCIATGRFHSSYIRPHKLGKEIHDDSYIQMTIKVDNSFYEYSVSFNASSILQESLFKVNLRSRKMVFERKRTSRDSVYSFGTVSGKASNAQFLEFVSKGCPDDESFVNEYVKRNAIGLADITKVHNWFDNKLNVIFTNSKFRSMPVFLNKDKKFAENINNLLCMFNAGAEGIAMIPVDFDKLDITPEKKNRVQNDLKKNPDMMITMVDYDALYFFEMDNNIISCSKEVTLHKNALGKDVPFDLFEESDGTKRLLDFLPMLIDLKENSSVYVIDELDRSMHTLLTRALLNYYFRLLTPEKDAQLICTTHETYLLDDDMLRPDQFWFIRKNKGASSLYTMGNQRLRRIVSNAYLHGGLELKPKME